MKKTLLTALAALSFCTAFAQFPAPPVQTTFGIKAGVNRTTMSLTADASGLIINPGYSTNFSAGVFADVAVTERFSIQPGVYYSGKGFSYKHYEQQIDGTSTYTYDANLKSNIAYIQVPVNFLFNSTFNAGRLFIGGGPFAAVAIKASASGYIKERYEDGPFVIDLDGDVDPNVEIGTQDGVKRLDYGVTGLAGFRLNNGFLVSANYDYGIANINGDKNSQGKAKTRTITLSLGFSF
ncbi:porin family protein [Mucilaginibacter terrae]|uniref:Outer membrane protein beta-barrel domain-containing protein n=1 Tax=Mucilaginibacter terrae TaxID=1955052 RepID=A0ABU3GZ46_9SPHI|nr:porin family protein [Mucilaginibacter terrae]MDT3405048.1 hypothetical protein [Mucilaginibacter terrae]